MDKKTILFFSSQYRGLNITFLEEIHQYYLKSQPKYVNLHVEPYKTRNKKRNMAYTSRLGQSDDFRREELIKAIEQSIERLTLQELEALYYDMSTKNYINDLL